MFFQHVYEKGLAQGSYFIGCQATGEAIVIDPKRDIDTYLEIAAREKMKITKITETHIHADFLSGVRELAQATGAEVLLSDEGGADWQYQFPHTGLNDGSQIKVGNLVLNVFHTPGHTPEHICFLLTDVPAGSQPVMFFSGDFVFVGDVGRPDLLEKAAGVVGSQEIGAKQMFDSLKKFRALPDFVQVWPGHGAGSACGKALGAVPSTTVGYEKLLNWALRETDERAFIKKLLDGQPEPPKYFSMMKKLNREGAPILGGIPKIRSLSLEEFKANLEKDSTVVDARNKAEFAEAHIPGSLNIQGNASFSNWAGWILDYDKPFVIVAPEERRMEIQRKLIRIGLDQLLGFFNFSEWRSAGLKTDAIKQIYAKELHDRLEKENITVVDVRATNEFSEGHIKNVKHIHLGYLSKRAAELTSSSPLVIQCAGGDRSVLACSLLKKMGRHDIVNLIGGISAWKQEGFDVIV